MFEAKLNYLICGVALVFLLLLGRFAFLQVNQHERYLERSQDGRTRIELLPPDRADIYSADGKRLAHSETVWDIYLDYEAFAAPQTLALRATRSPDIYDLDAVEKFLAKSVKPLETAKLAAPAGRRRFFLNWQLRKDPVARRDLEICADRLGVLTGLTRESLLAKLTLIENEVDALMPADPKTAKGGDINAAWLRADPAVGDTEYWSKVRRYPRSLAFEPVLAARLAWAQREAEFLRVLAARAEDATQLRDLCWAAAKNCEQKARGIAPDASVADVLGGESREEYAAWKRLASLCNNAVRRGGNVIEQAVNDLTRHNGIIEGLRERLERLRKDVIEQYKRDYDARWRHYDFDESPLLLVKDASRDVVELIKVNADLLPGVVCVHRASRSYDEAEALAHVLGSVGLPDEARVNELVNRGTFGEGLEEFVGRWFDNDHAAFATRFDSAVALQAAGVSGLERSYDERLSGLYGARVSVHDARGRQREIEFERAPLNTPDMQLTLDLELQRDILATVAQWEKRLALKARKDSAETFARGKAAFDRWQRYPWSWRGAAVVMDVQTGAVLALASFPGYDPAKFSGGSEADRAYRNAILDEAAREEELPYWLRKTRFMSRAAGSTYHPGSTMKALTALALIDSGAITPGDTFDELSSIIEIGGTKLRTGHPAGANINLTRALEKSCNGYFYTMSQKLGGSPREGWEVLRGYAERLGIGIDGGLDLSGVRTARLPDGADIWAPNLALLAIGQGEIEMTPLDVCRLYACIANGEIVPPAHLSAEAMVSPMPLEISEDALKSVREGLRRVVAGSEGTAREYQVLKRIRCAGKTGTAENGKGKPDHAWFAGYAPSEEPRVAFCILAEFSDLYGSDISPVIGECIERYLVRTGVLKAPAPLVVKGKKR
ncbi:MAG: hypothetical protein IT462_00305 [Planctomycetes bacterium]|nr:hypothetical protein [Planctomycetota bacterium]